MLTKELFCGKIFFVTNAVYAGVAQLVEQLICNQQVGGSSPSTSSKIDFAAKAAKFLWENSRAAKGGRL